jgi:hypothetical protein
LLFVTTQETPEKAGGFRVFALFPH